MNFICYSLKAIYCRYIIMHHSSAAFDLGKHANIGSNSRDELKWFNAHVHLHQVGRWDHELAFITLMMLKNVLTIHDQTE